MVVSGHVGSGKQLVADDPCVGVRRRRRRRGWSHGGSRPHRVWRWTSRRGLGEGEDPPASSAGRRVARPGGRRRSSTRSTRWVTRAAGASCDAARGAGLSSHIRAIGRRPRASPLARTPHDLQPVVVHRTPATRSRTGAGCRGRSSKGSSNSMSTARVAIRPQRPVPAAGTDAARTAIDVRFIGARASRYRADAKPGSQPAARSAAATAAARPMPDGISRAAWRWSRPTRASQRWTCVASAAG